MSRLIFLIFIVWLFGCKKEINNNSNGNSTNNQNVNLRAFYITVEDTTSTTASISWTSASDSSSDTSVTYSIYLDSTLVATKIKLLTYRFSLLTPNKKYGVTIRAFNSINDSISSTISFTTKDSYLKFVKQILPDGSQVSGFDISPDRGYIFTYQGILDTTFSGDGPITRQFHVLKTDSIGNAIWNRTFAFPYTSIGFLIKATSDGYLILGNNFIIKIDFNGNLIWKKIFSTNELVNLTSFVETQNKNIIITGIQGSETTAFMMISLGSNGNINWQKTYTGDQRLYAPADLVEIPNDNSIMVLGEIGSNFGLWKCDMSGNFISSKSFGDPRTETLPTHIKYSKNQLIVSGTSVGDYRVSQMKIYRLDLDGNVLNKNLLSTPDYFCQIQWMELTNDGGYVVLTFIIPIEGPGYHQIFKYDSDDIKQWENTYYEFNYGKVIKQTPDGGYIFPPMSSISSNPLLVKTNQYGQY